MYIPDINLLPTPEYIKMYSANGVPYPHPELTEWEKENCNQWGFYTWSQERRDDQ